MKIVWGGSKWDDKRYWTFTDPPLHERWARAYGLEIFGVFIGFIVERDEHR